VYTQIFAGSAEVSYVLQSPFSVAVASELTLVVDVLPDVTCMAYPKPGAVEVYPQKVTSVA
jgi:hypothetical protein